MDFAIDGYVLTGAVIAYEFIALPAATTVNLTTPAAADAVLGPETVGTVAVAGQTIGANFGSITQAITDPNIGTQFMLITSNEFLGASFVMGLTVLLFSTKAMSTAQTTTADYGTLRKIMGAALTTSGTNLSAVTWTNIFWVGHKAGKGTAGAGVISSNVTLTKTLLVFTDSTYQLATGILSITAPTGGVAQFKGTTIGATETKYVEVICNGIAPMFYTTAW